MNKAKYEIGIIGLGTMGRNLLLNMADHGLAGAGYDKNPAQVDLLQKEDKTGLAKGFTDINAFIASLNTPRAIIMLVPAGIIVDSVIEELLPLLTKGDVLIDSGNSYYTDTDRRDEYLQKKGMHFFGMGISGGEEGARKGPSMMPGGDKTAYAVMKPILEAIAAKVNNDPCVAYIGKSSAGHFVKMVHNGIEYGVMQLLAETYEILQKGLQLDNDAIGSIFKKWNEGKLLSFLMETTRDIFSYKEEGSDHLLLDDIKDEAKAKGTGKWTSQVAMNLEVPIPTIDTAVALRDLSKYKTLRVAAAQVYKEGDAPLQVNKDEFLNELEQAFYFSMIIIYSQGMHLLSKASVEYKYDLRLAEIAKIWRGGCIIRSSFLNAIFAAYTKDINLPHLLLDKEVEQLVKENVKGARSVLSKIITNGIGAPAYASAVSYFDNFRNQRMPSNLIQAQRDYFGAHGYELINKEGVFHTQWTPKK